MSIIGQITEVILTNRRHKRYQRELSQAHIHRVPAPMLGSQIRQIRTADEPDFSRMFRGW